MLWIEKGAPREDSVMALPLSFVSRDKSEKVEDFWADIIDDCAPWHEKADRLAGKAHPIGRMIPRHNQQQQQKPQQPQ